MYPTNKWELKKRKGTVHSVPLFMEMRMNLKFYSANADYCEFLRRADPKVPCIGNKKNARPFVGVLLTIGRTPYFAPLTSPKAKHKTMKNQTDFLKINDGKWGAINFNNMLPIHLNNLTELDTRIQPSDSKADIDYKNLLINQLSWCNSNKTIILNQAKKLYDQITKNGARPKLIARCCDFVKIEEQYRVWCAAHNFK